MKEYKLITVRRDGTVCESLFSGYYAESASDYYFKKEVEGTRRSDLLFALTLVAGGVRHCYISEELRLLLERR